MEQNNPYSLRGPNLLIKSKYSHVHLYNTFITFHCSLKIFMKDTLFDITFLWSQRYFLEKEFIKIR